jgi:hypothetical protein
MIDDHYPLEGHERRAVRESSAPGRLRVYQGALVVGINKFWLDLETFTDHHPAHSF